MIEELKNIEVKQLLSIYQSILGVPYKSFIENVGDIQEENGYGTYFVKPRNEYFKSIEVSVNNNKLSQVTLICETSFGIKDVESNYLLSRKVYSPQDDTEVVFFKYVDREFLMLMETFNKPYVKRITFLFN